MILGLLILFRTESTFPDIFLREIDYLMMNIWLVKGTAHRKCISCKHPINHSIQLKCLFTLEKKFGVKNIKTKLIIMQMITMIEWQRKVSYLQQPIEEAPQSWEGQESFRDLKSQQHHVNLYWWKQRLRSKYSNHKGQTRIRINISLNYTLNS